VQSAQAAKVALAIQRKPAGVRQLGGGGGSAIADQVAAGSGVDEISDVRTRRGDGQQKQD